MEGSLFHLPLVSNLFTHNTFPFNRRELISAIQTKHMIIGMTYEERKAFMTWMLPEQTADIKGEDDVEFFVEKVITMHVNKEGRKEFLVKWVGYPLSKATWEPFENISGEKASDYQVIFIHKFTIRVYISTQNILFKGEEALAMKRGGKGIVSSRVN